MALSPKETKELYRKRARRYALTARLYWLVGFRYTAYRRIAVAALGLAPGDTVVELGCGTGENFPLLRAAVGPQGRVIGVDLTDAMLREARERVRAAGWDNVELVESDVAAYVFPSEVDGVISTYALTLSPAYDDVIHRARQALPPGKRMVVLDFKRPCGWPLWALELWLPLVRPFGVTLDLAERHPWESIGRDFSSLRMSEHYRGLVYVATGEV